LHEAALGVQYLHAREVVHGDLKGNNVVVGSDLKAKVTDFGLSLAVDSEATAPISGAWQWVAPECLVAKKGEQTAVKPTFESDVYSLGMCIVEALRVVEAVQAGQPSSVCLPWGVLPPYAVKFHVTSGKLPSRPSLCTDEQWNLVTRMCVLDPKKRLKISTVADELKKFVETSTGLDTNNQVDSETCVVTALADPVDAASVVSMTAAARKLLSQLQGDTNQQDDSPVVLYSSLGSYRARARTDRRGRSRGSLLQRIPRPGGGGWGVHSKASGNDERRSHFVGAGSDGVLRVESASGQAVRRLLSHEPEGAGVSES
jgi:serine/threonine protein kinase